MDTSNDTRREVAEDLRHLSYGGRVRYKEEFFELLDETVMDPGTGYHEMNDIFDRLADLIDRPTCHEVKVTKEESYYGPTIFHHELSCGHTCETGLSKPPKYCGECGAEVMDDE